MATDTAPDNLVVPPTNAQSPGESAALKKNDNGNGRYQPVLPSRTAKVVISRSGDADTDAARVGEVHHLLCSYPGPDRFCFLIKARGETWQLDFPNDTTTLDETLIEQLKTVPGVESVQISLML